MASDFDPTTFCTRCNGPIADPGRRLASGEQEPIRHVGVPGEPADCPK
ncbi:hypothetical protein [Streptomyces brevispora]